MGVKVFTDKLQHIASEAREHGSDIDIDPVDAFGGYVAVDKYAADNMKKTQKNIQWKTALEQSYEGGED